jgi:hypothetical protein
MSRLPEDAKETINQEVRLQKATKTAIKITRMGKAPLYIPAVAISIERWKGISTPNPHLRTQSRYA